MSPEEAAAAAQTAADAAKQSAEVANDAAIAAQGYAYEAADAVANIAYAATGGAIDPFVFRLSIFVLAIFVGYYVVWSVTPALHTPLMSVTNAISSVIIVGALIATGAESWAATLFGFIAAALAAVNIFGGFAVTERMLAMFKKRG
jgi:NAD(P) transhydrogenase subunit alpha